MVLKEVIFNSFSYLEACDGPERTDFVTFPTFGGIVVVFKEEIFNSF